MEIGAVHRTERPLTEDGNTSSVGFGLIGCGTMGASLVESLVEIDGVKLAGVMDSDPKQAASIADKYGGVATTNLDEMLARPDIDAVIIASPGFLHREHAERSFAAGKHVFCEKPMALNPADCEAMIRARDASGKKLMIGQVLRYIGVFNYTREFQAAGKLGDVVSLRITRSSGGWGGWWRSWRSKEELSGGVLFEFSVHEMDFMMDIAGDAASVYAVSKGTQTDKVDYETMYMLTTRFESGAIGQLSAGIADPIGKYCGEFVGTKGAVHFDASRGELVSKTGDEDAQTIRLDSLDYEKPVRREIREFVDAIRNDTDVTIPGEEGLRVIRVADAARTSAKTGKTIEL